MRFFIVCRWIEGNSRVKERFLGFCLTGKIIEIRIKGYIFFNFFDYCILSLVISY